MSGRAEPLVPVVAPATASGWGRDTLGLIASRYGMTALLVLAVALSVTLLAWRDARVQSDDYVATRFTAEVDRYERALEQRLLAYEQILRAAGAFVRAQTSVDSAAWARFHGDLAIDQRYPGLRHLAYAPYLRAPQPRDDSAAQDDGSGPVRILVPIHLVEPHEANRRALGYDMFADPVRRAAIEAARDDGRLTATGPVNLVVGDPGEAGFLIYMPIYDLADPAAVETRRASFRGVVSAAFRMEDLMAGLGLHHPGLRVRIHDAAGPGPGPRLYDSSGQDGGADNPATGLATSRSLRVGDRPWTVRYEATPAFASLHANPDRPWQVLSIGALISLLLFLVVLATASAGHRARRLARQMTEALRESEAQFALLADEVRDHAIYLLDREGRIRTWNAGCERLKGYRAEEVLGRHVGLFYPREALDRGRPHDLLATATREGHVEDEGWRVRRDGSRFWANVVITALHDRFGQVRGFAKITRDMSERRAREQEREALIEALNLRLRELDCMYRVANLVVHETRPEALLEATARLLPQGLRDGDSASAHVVYRGRAYPSDAPPCPARLIAPIHVGGEAVGEVRVGTDGDGIADEDRALADSVAAMLGDAIAHHERAGELARYTEDLEAFSYSVSHDLRTPLRAIAGFSRVLLENLGDTLSGKERDYLERIDAAARRMSRMIDELLSFSRVARGAVERQPVDVSRLAEEAVASRREAEPEREVEIDIAPGLVVQGDPELLRHVVQNLVDNAWKYSAETASPRIEVGRLDRGHDGFEGFYVRDNGIGFDMQYADKLFRTFERLHGRDRYPGTGIGLAIVRRIVERHDGRVGAEGEPGRGATFRIELPATQES